MALRVYNTLSGQKETFKPFSEGVVTMYVCGPTVYDSSHIGHAMSALVFDVVRRYLEFRGYQVQHAMNFTDVDDKIINRANAEKIEWRTLIERYVNEYLEGMDALNVQRATAYPRATAEMANIIADIQILIDKGAAYPAEGDVYYRVAVSEGYGNLKHQSLDELRAGERIEIDQRKENPLDFALWKAAKPGEPSWESPWGSGRPGWHIECSAMILAHLGEQIDIHGGGADLIFPHHSNEIAQSESLTGQRPFVKYWMHNGLLQFGSDKMSKSLKNFVTIQDILKQGDPDNLRMFVLNGVYRNPLSYTEESFEAAGRGLQRLKSVFAFQIGDPTSTEGNAEAGETLQKETEATRTAFIEAMDDDFNTAQAVASLFNLVTAINKGRDGGAAPFALNQARETLGELGGVLGLRVKPHYTIQGAGLASSTEVGIPTIISSPSDSTPFVTILTSIRDELQAAGQTALADKISDRLKELDSSSSIPFIEMLVSTRRELRSIKQFALADKLRNDMKEAGIILEDRSDGTIWKSGSYQSAVIK